jgi:hypothetical protein
LIGHISGKITIKRSESQTFVRFYLFFPLFSPNFANHEYEGRREIHAPLLAAGKEWTAER